MNAFLQTLRNLGPMRLVAIAVVGISLLGMLGFITTRISTSPLALLYTELDQHDSAAIAQKLDALKIPYQVDSSGTLIRVPSDQVGKIRMMMAADGLPKGGSIGYEIFDQKEGFGTTSFVQNINHLRALEGELARTIGSMDPILTSRVHLVLPQRELFSHSTQAATASIFLKTRNGAVLTREQIASIQHLIAAAVPQLQPGQVSIVDDRGNLLARPSNASTGAMGGGASDQEDMRIQFEQTQARKIEDLLTQTLGYGKVRAQVSADLDFDRITTSSEIFDPDSQVVRSTQSVSEAASNSEGGNAGAATVANNLPTTPQQIAGGAGGGSNNNNNRSEETINYEINKTIRNQVRESGQIRRLSVAVVVDGSYKTAEDGKTTTYVPRTEAELNKIKDLVRSAVNFDAARGDVLEVANMQFAQEDIAKELSDGPTNMLMGIPRADIFHAVETLILAIIGLLVVLLVVRPILKKILETSPGVSSETAYIGGGGAAVMASLGGASGGVAQLPSPAAAAASQAEADAAAAESEIERMIDISRVEGRVKASSLRKVGEIVDKHPEEAIGILRNWMYQENR
ncbi:MAG: flagellar basal-body MS-ring/collar protein FliF [Alphaproteobacteria bacterium]|nr:flagellar basal-body MS-ring/collar protein FliF [Alphaproteobacteria bacterium]